MSITKKEEIKQLQVENIEQEKINKELREISKKLSKIPNISFDYIAALIYVIYEYQQDEVFLNENDIERTIYKIDKYIEEIRYKENAKNLFKNIRFRDIINEDNFIAFDKIIIDLKILIKKLQQAGDKSKSILAEAFEYIIMKAAKNNEISFNQGEFYTPKGVIKTMLNLLRIKNETSIYDPACGTGGFLSESAKYAKMFALGEEIERISYNICMTNLWLHDIDNKLIKENSEKKIIEDEYIKVDLAIANPPFADDTKIEDSLINLYYEYDVISSTGGYKKYLVRMLDKLNDNGRMAIILPHGFLFKKTEYYLRRNLLERKWINAIIGLPENLFYKTRIPVIILVIDKSKRRDEILFIDASRDYTSKRKNNILTINNQNKILSTYNEYKTIDNYSYVANINEIIDNEYDLSIKRYVKVKKQIEVIEPIRLEKSINKLEEKKSQIQYDIRQIIQETRIKW